MRRGGAADRRAAGLRRLRAGRAARRRGAPASVSRAAVKSRSASRSAQHLLQVMDHATLTDNTGRRRTSARRCADHDVERRVAELSARSFGFGIGDDAAPQPRRAGRRTPSSACSAPSSATGSTRRAFLRLTPRVMETIVEKFILQLEAQLSERRVEISLVPGTRLAGDEGLRPDLWRAPPRA